MLYQLNTSTLGYSLIPDLNNDKPIDTPLPDFFDNIIDDGVDEATESANEIVNKIADAAADALGIHEWYSLHVMDACFGSYKPNATAPGANKNGTRCTRDIAMSEPP